MKGICGEWFSARFFKTFLHIPIHSEVALGLSNETAYSIGKPALKAFGLESECCAGFFQEIGRESLGGTLGSLFHCTSGPGGRREYSRLASVNPCAGALRTMLGLSPCLLIISGTLAHCMHCLLSNHTNPRRGVLLSQFYR